MAIRCDPARLSAELRAAGIPPTAFSGCRSGGPLETVAWLPGHPTPAEQAAADAVLAAHDPDASEKENAAERQRMTDALATIEDPRTNMDDWRAAISVALPILARHGFPGPQRGQ